MKCTIVVFSLLLSGSPVWAGQHSFRCGTHLASVGDSMDKVVANCGEPTGRSVKHLERVVRRERTDVGKTGDTTAVELRELIPIETWEYDFGPTKFVGILTFENEILVDIQTGGRGSDR